MNSRFVVNRAKAPALLRFMHDGESAESFTHNTEGNETRAPIMGGSR